MKILAAILSLFISSLLFCQKKVVEFGEITPEEIAMNSYEKDPEAKAVVLYDKGESIFFDSKGGYDIKFTRHKRVKIFDKSESQHSEISIPYYVDGYGKTEEVKSIEAYTYYTEDGILKRKTLDPSTVYNEKLNERWFYKKFVFPDVQDGSILELRYILETPFHFNLPDWSFQDKIPTLYSEYEVSMIPFYEYAFIAQGVSKFDYQNSVITEKERTWGTINEIYGKNYANGIKFQDYVHTYALMDVPAFKDESNITSINDYIAKMDFQLAKVHHPDGRTSDIISTWSALNEDLLKHDKFGKYIKGGSRFAKKIIEEDLDLVGLNEDKKAIKIIEYVKNNFEWNGYNSKYTSQSVKDFTTKKNGNSADINLFLIALLNQADIKAEPLILSTRNHGKINSDYPFSHFTNYVIALVNISSPFLTDASEDLLPYNRLPTRCLNEMGLVVNKDDDPKWISLRQNILSLEKKAIKLEIDSLSLNARTSISIQSTEYESFNNRRKFRDDTIKIKEYYANKIGSIEACRTLGYQNTSFPYSMSFKGVYETEKLGQNIVIKPFLELPLSSNDLTQKKRNYPVDFIYAEDQQFESNLKIPDNYFISDLPEPYELDNDLAEIKLDYTISGQTLSVRGNYKFKKAIYVAYEYSRIKYYRDQIVEYFNQPIVLEPKN